MHCGKIKKKGRQALQKNTKIGRQAPQKEDQIGEICTVERLTRKGDRHCKRIQR
jgi:hypothetical protein